MCRVELGEYSGSRTRRGSHRSRNGVIEAVLEAFRQTRVVCEAKKMAVIVETAPRGTNAGPVVEMAPGQSDVMYVSTGNVTTHFMQDRGRM